MMSIFRSSLEFFNEIGLYDVVLPFLLVFTLVFGVLEKSKILGTEKVKDAPQSRKNLNAMVAFVTAFFVVASSQLVSIINGLVAKTALILVILVMLMLLIASFHSEQDDKGFNLNDWKGWLSIVVLVAVVLIFLDEVGWLQQAWYYVTTFSNSTMVGTIFLFIIVAGFIAFLTKDPDKTDKKSDS